MERFWRPHVLHCLFQYEEQETHLKQTQEGCTSIKLQVTPGIPCHEMLWIVKETGEGVHEQANERENNWRITPMTLLIFTLGTWVPGPQTAGGSETNTALGSMVRWIVKQTQRIDSYIYVIYYILFDCLISWHFFISWLHLISATFIPQ